MSHRFTWSIVFLTILNTVFLPAQQLHRIGTLGFPTDENRYPHAFPNTGFVVVNSDNGAVRQLYSFDGRLISDEKYTQILAPQCGLLLMTVKRPGEVTLAGYLDSTGRVVVPPIYDRAEPMQYGRAAVRKQDGAYFLIDSTGHTTPLPGRYSDCQTIAPGLFCAENRSGKKGVIYADGRVKVPFEYGQIYKQGELDFYRVLHGNWLSGDTHEGLVNGRGEVVIPIGDQQVWASENYIHVFVSGVGDVYYDTTGQRITDPNFRPPRTGDGRYVYEKMVGNTTRYGLLDSNFQVLTEPVFDLLGEYTRFGLFFFQERGAAGLRSGLLNRRGERIIEQNGYVTIDQLSPQDILVKLRRGKCLWFDGSGRPLLPDTIPKLQDYFAAEVKNPDDTTRFSVLAVSLGGQKYGLYDRRGQALTPEQYDTLYYLTRDKVVFRENRQYGLLDARGHVLVPAQYDNIRLLKNPALQAILPIKNGYWGLLTMDGRELLPTEYAPGQIEMLGRHHLWARRGKEWEIYAVE